MVHRIFERQISHRVRWNDMKMTVGYLESGDNQPDSFACVELLLSGANFFGHKHQVA